MNYSIEEILFALVIQNSEDLNELEKALDRLIDLNNEWLRTEGEAIYSREIEVLEEYIINLKNVK